MGCMRAWSIALLAVGLAGCASPATRDAPAAAAESGTPAHDGRLAVAWVQTAAEYEALTRMVFQSARHRLDPIIAAARADQLREWSAMPADEYQGDDAGQPPAVIFDLDQTLIDSSGLYRRLIATGAEPDPATRLAWLRAARARAIPGAVEFARWLEQRGVRVHYISNRTPDEREATLATLRSLGFPLDPDGGNLLLRDDAAGFGRDKGSRRRLVDREHRVIALFGDGLGDFLGGADADLETRRARVAPYQSWWGERWFVLPNPMPGAWLDAITAACRGDGSGDDRRACIDRFGRLD
jgi:acid phosphatase